MFCTLKRSRGADESYAFEMTNPPFSKPRSKFGVTACTNCRASKLKCTGEPHGCQRCLAKKLQCSYSSLRKGSCQNNGQTQSPGTLQGPVDETADIENPDQAYIVQDIELSFDPLDSLDSVEATSLHVPSTVVSDDENTLVPYALTGSSFSFAADLSSEPWNDANLYQNIESISGSTAQSTIANFDSSPYFHYPDMKPAENLANIGQICTCFSRAANIYETIEVNLVWSRNEQTSDAVDMLQHQKQTMTDCELILECRQCITQSSFIMLLLSMCNKILGALEAVCHDCQLKDVGSGSKGRPKGKGSSTEIRRRGFRVSKRQLDEDDERLVLKSLFHARVTRLDVLVGRLEKLVREQNWPAHRERGVLEDHPLLNSTRISDYQGTENRG
ncbi:hypothetical protein F5B20DRAFT_593792 [Whalleya microplaca]|nr:hypothetical protein F5B20DRAFT_593792 [Whalleya microplaca]